MEKPSFRLVGQPCGQHGQYTFYKAIRLTGEKEKIIAIGDFFFVKIWHNTDLVSIGELQLVWTDRIADQTLVSLRLYFLPENTPDGRNHHGEHEVVAINEKVVVRAEDLPSWLCDGRGWRWGLRAVWRGACAPLPENVSTAPLHHTKIDFSDVESERSTIEQDKDAPGVVVFSYPRYCRYRAVVSRLEGLQEDWLRSCLVSALGGFAANTTNTCILYCKDTFDYPELESHEFVCNHLAPKLKGRARGRRRGPGRRPRSRSHSSRSSESEGDSKCAQETKVQTPRRLSLRNGNERHSSEDQDSKVSSPEHSADKAFLHQLRVFYRKRNEPFKAPHSLKHLSLRGLYAGVMRRGGYEVVCARKLWRDINTEHPARTRSHYERYLLPFENHERMKGVKYPKLNGITGEPRTIDQIDITDSPLRETDPKAEPKDRKEERRLRTPSPKKEKQENDLNKELDLTTKPIETKKDILDVKKETKDEKPVKIAVKSVEKLIEPKNSEVLKIFEQNSALISELVAKHNLKDGSDEKDGSTKFLSELAQKLNLGSSENKELSRPDSGRSNGVPNVVNGHTKSTPDEQKSNRPSGRSSLRDLRAVRVKATRANNSHTQTSSTSTVGSRRTDSASSSPPQPVTNFGIHHPPPQPDDDIVEVPYKPATPEIIDLDAYPESPVASKRKKLEALRERGLEVTALPAWGGAGVAPPLTPLIAASPIILNPALQHQIMTQAQLFQMYNVIPQNYANGIHPPRVVQGVGLYGNSGPERTVYGNPKDPFMPPPHTLFGAPVKPQKNLEPTNKTPPKDILDLTCKTSGPSPVQRAAVEIVRVPTTPSPSKVSSTAQNLTKNYTLIDGKAIVGSNLEITLVNPKATTPKPAQKRSSNGKFMSAKTPTPPKDYPKPYPSPAPSGTHKKPSITIPNYQMREDASPTSSTGSRDSQQGVQNALLQNVFKSQNLAQLMELQKSVPPVSPFMDPMYMSALYGGLGAMDQRQLALYMASQFRGYSGLLNMGAPALSTPTTKN